VVIRLGEGNFAHQTKCLWGVGKKKVRVRKKKKQAQGAPGDAGEKSVKKNSRGALGKETGKTKVHVANGCLGAWSRLCEKKAVSQQRERKKKGKGGQVERDTKQGVRMRVSREGTGGGGSLVWCEKKHHQGR